jgi:hypothetical protein
LSAQKLHPVVAKQALQSALASHCAHAQLTASRKKNQLTANSVVR